MFFIFLNEQLMSTVHFPKFTSARERLFMRLLSQAKRVWRLSVPIDAGHE